MAKEHASGVVVAIPVELIRENLPSNAKLFHGENKKFNI
jgi:hypothetical protein